MISLLNPHRFEIVTATGITVESLQTQVIGPGGSAVVSLSNVAENDMIVVWRVCDDNDSNTTLTGYTLVGPQSAFLTTNYEFAGATPYTSVTVTGIDAGRSTLAVIAVIRGVDTSNPWDVTEQRTSGANASSETPPPITTVTDGALVIAMCFLDDDVTTVNTFPTGYTNTTQGTAGSDGSGCTFGLATKTVETAGLESPSQYTFGNIDTVVATTQALRPAA